MRGRSPSSSLASSPTMVGAITTLIVIVAVFLAYNANQRPAVRAGLQRLGRDPERRPADRQQRGADRRPPRRRRRVDRGDPPRGDEEPAGDASGDRPGGLDSRQPRRHDRAAQPEARQERSTRCPQDSTFRVRYRSSFGLKYLEITRGDGPPRARGLHVPRHPDRRADRVRRHRQHLRHRDADQRARSTSSSTATPSPAAGRRSTRRSSRSTRCSPTSSRSRGSSPRARPGSTASSPRSPRRRGSSPRSPRSRPSCSGTWRSPSARSPRTPRRSRRRSPRARRRSRPGIDALPRPAALPARLHDALAAAAPRRPRPADLAADAERRDRRRHATVLARTPRDEPRAQARLRRAQAARRAADDEAVAAAPARRPSPRRRRSRSRSCPAQTVCNYWNYWFTLLPEHITEQDQIGFMQRVGGPAFPFGALELATGSPVLPTLTAPGEVQTPLGGYSGLQANGRAYDPTVTAGGEFEPYELPILHGNPYGPTGQKGTQRRLPGRPDRLPARASCRFPGQSPSNPGIAVSDIPGSRGPTTAFWDQNGTDRAARHPSPVEAAVRPGAAQAAPEPCRRPDRARGHRDRVPARVHQAAAVVRRLRDQGGVHDGAEHPPQRARCGSPASTSARSPSVEPLSAGDEELAASDDSTSRTTTSDGTTSDGTTQPSGQQAALVTMEIKDDGAPDQDRRDDAAAPAALPRGQPLRRPAARAAPAAEEATDGYTVPIDQTSISVQLDQVLTTLQSDVRTDLQVFLQEFGSALIDNGGAEGFQELYRTSPARVQVHGRRSTRRCSAPSRTTSRA